MSGNTVLLFWEGFLDVGKILGLKVGLSIAFFGIAVLLGSLHDIFNLRFKKIL